jgi:hypothetical protein
VLFAKVNVSVVIATESDVAFPFTTPMIVPIGNAAALFAGMVSVMLVPFM